jgi:hypothetical protein
MTTRSILAAELITLVLVARSSAQAAPTFQPPPSGEAPEIGVAYEVSAYCVVPIQVGSSWFSFIHPAAWPPPMWWEYGEPYEVPGTITLTTPTEAVFRAVSDGSELAMRLGGGPGTYCL